MPVKHKITITSPSQAHRIISRHPLRDNNFSPRLDIFNGNRPPALFPQLKNHINTPFYSLSSSCR